MATRRYSPHKYEQTMGPDAEQKETLLPPKLDRVSVEDDSLGEDGPFVKETPKKRISACMFSPRGVVGLGLILLFSVLSLYEVFGRPHRRHRRSCDTVFDGYTCLPELSQHWGQYSPYFKVPSEIPEFVPDECEVTFAQLLSRHGARYPTPHKTEHMNAVVKKLKSARPRSPKYAFLEDYEYELGADDLTLFGQQQMINVGTQFYHRYQHLTRSKNPFVRTASQERVVVSAINFTQGFHEAKAQDERATGSNPREYKNMVVISESTGSNNTLGGSTCTNFRHGPVHQIGRDAASTWSHIFVPPIQARLNDEVPGADLSVKETVSVMELCPFETVHSARGAVSDFCHLFSGTEWREYSYLQSLGKWYGYGNGNPLGPSQGVGFANELVARMTGRPVRDTTSTNHTLDADPATFPLGPDAYLFADFSHDNDMITIFSGMGLFNLTPPQLPRTAMLSIGETAGYSAAWAVPFAGRAYFEKMKCRGQDEDLVRVLLNDRVVPLQACGADELGRCRLSAWIESLAFATTGGHWHDCFTHDE